MVIGRVGRTIVATAIACCIVSCVGGTTAKDLSAEIAQIIASVRDVPGDEGVARIKALALQRGEMGSSAVEFIRRDLESKNRMHVYVAVLSLDAAPIQMANSVCIEFAGRNTDWHEGGEPSYRSTVWFIVTMLALDMKSSRFSAFYAFVLDNASDADLAGRAAFGLGLCRTQDAFGALQRSLHRNQLIDFWGLSPDANQDERALSDRTVAPYLAEYGEEGINMLRHTLTSTDNETIAKDVLRCLRRVGESKDSRLCASWMDWSKGDVASLAFLAAFELATTAERQKILRDLSSDRFGSILKGMANDPIPELQDDLFSRIASNRGLFEENLEFILRSQTGIEEMELRHPVSGFDRFREWCCDRGIHVKDPEDQKKINGEEEGAARQRQNSE